MTAMAQWSTAQLSQGRSKAYPVVVGHKAYFIGGEIQGVGYSNTVDSYDDSTKTWSKLALTFSTRDYLNQPAIAHGKKIFVIPTGEASFKTINIIDTEQNTVKEASLSQTVSNITLGAVGDLVFFIGGSQTNQIDIYNIRTEQWTTSAFPEPRLYSVCGTLGQKLFIAGGLTQKGASKRVDIYDATTGTWDTASLSVPRSMMTVAHVGDQLVFAGGGVPDFIFFNAVDIYDNKTGTWSSAKLSQNVYGNILRGTVSGDKAFFTGGDKPNNVDMYDAQTKTWQTLTAPSSHQFNPVVSNGQKVFFAGGLNNTTGQVDVYDCETNTWSNLGKLSVKRYYAAGASVGRNVLFAGGISNSAVVDIYTLPPSNVSKVATQPFEAIVFPNPSRDWFYLRLNEAFSGNFSLISPDGIILNTQQIDNKQIIEVNTAHLPVGSYIWQCIDGKSGKIKSDIVTKVAH